MKKTSFLYLAILALGMAGFIACNSAESSNAGDANAAPATETTTYANVDAMVAEAKASIAQITVADFKAAYDNGDEYVLLDVREQNEYNGGYIPYCVLMPRGVLEFRISNESVWDNEGLYAPEKDALIYIYCKKGSRGALAAKSLESMGYTNVKNIDGGFNAWKVAYPDDVEVVEVPEGGAAPAADEGGC